jgi:hypothetical protein
MHAGGEGNFAARTTHAQRESLTGEGGSVSKGERMRRRALLSHLDLDSVQPANALHVLVARVSEDAALPPGSVITADADVASKECAKPLVDLGDDGMKMLTRTPNLLVAAGVAFARNGWIRAETSGVATSCSRRAHPITREQLSVRTLDPGSCNDPLEIASGAGHIRLESVQVRDFAVVDAPRSVGYSAALL